MNDRLRRTGNALDRDWAESRTGWSLNWEGRLEIAGILVLRPHCWRGNRKPGRTWMRVVQRHKVKLQAKDEGRDMGTKHGWFGGM